MNSTPPTINEWRRLYEAAQAVKRQAPWQWMDEEDVFCVQDPAMSQIALVSVMGALAEHYGIAAYLGAEGIAGYHRIQGGEIEDDPSLFLEIPQLHTSFESRDQLAKEDLAVIRELGLRYRGPAAWPLFRTYRPGYFPWFMETWELRFMTFILEQLLIVAPRFQEAPEKVGFREEGFFLARVPVGKEDALTWEDRKFRLTVRLPSPKPKWDAEALVRLGVLPVTDTAMEIDFFLLPAAIGEAGSRPCCAYMLMAADAETGLLVGAEVLTADPSIVAMWEQTPTRLQDILFKLGHLPSQIRLKNPTLHQLFKPLAKETAVQLKKIKRLPKLDQARKAFEQEWI